VKSGGSSRNTHAPLAIAPSTPLPSGLRPTRVYAMLSDRGRVQGDETRFGTAEVKKAGILGQPVFCSGYAQQTKHEDGRFEEGSWGVIAQLAGHSCYAMYGDKVTLLIYRYAGDAMYFDAPWAEGRRALTFESGLLHSRLSSSLQASNPHGVLCVGPRRTLSTATSSCVLELKDPECWGQVQPLHAAEPCLSETSDFHSG